MNWFILCRGPSSPAFWRLKTITPGLDDVPHPIQEPSAGALALPALPALPSAEETVSHIFFTSGSTNRPKGCICTLQNLQAYCAAKNVVHEAEWNVVHQTIR